MDMLDAMKLLTGLVEDVRDVVKEHCGAEHVDKVVEGVLTKWAARAQALKALLS